MTPLRQRLIDDMQVRNLAPATQRNYTRYVYELAKYFHQSPDQLTPDQSKQFQLHLLQERQLSPESVNQSMSAMKFLRRVTLEKDWADQKFPRLRVPQRLPVVLSGDEVLRRLAHVPGLKYRAALMSASGAGLRVAEVVGLKITDIDSSRRLLRVAPGKGNKDRYTLLPSRLLTVLRAWYRAAAQTLLTIARDPQHLGARIGFFAILHTWGQNLLHHPHLYCVVPGGGLAPDRQRWLSCRPGFFLPVRVLARLFRRLFLQALRQAHQKGLLHFYSDLAPLREPAAFARYLAPLAQLDWVVYAKPPFAGPHQVLNYLGRYTHRVAISNQRLLAHDETTVSFSGKDYRHHHRRKTLTLAASEFLRRFLLHAPAPPFPLPASPQHSINPHSGYLPRRFRSPIC